MHQHCHIGSHVCCYFTYNIADPKKRIAFTFYDDDSCVNVDLCEIVSQ